MPRERLRAGAPAGEDYHRRNDDDPIFAELESAVKINEHELDQACLQHADLFYRVSRALARVSADRDEAKISLSETEAFVDAELRRAFSDDERRPTETALSNQKANDPRVKTARKKLTGLNRLVGEYGALKEAYTQRSYALKGLIDLHMAGYFGDPANRSTVRNRQTDRASAARESMREQRERHSRDR